MPRIILAAMLAAMLAAPAASAAAPPHSVALSDAQYAPAFSVLIAPGESVALPRAIRACLTDVSAYRWNGAALGAQRHRNGLDVWRAPSGRAVTFNGRIFRNHLHAHALVAAWCE